MIAGDTVYVGAGTYTSEVAPASSGTLGSPISYIADTDGSKTGDAGAVTISTYGSSYGFRVHSRDYVEITGFSLRASGQYGASFEQGTGCKIIRCDASGSSMPGIRVAGASVSIERCVVQNLGANGIVIGALGAAQSTVTVTGVSITGVGQDCISITDSSAVAIQDSTLYNYSDDGVSISGSSQVTVSRCRFYGGPDGVYAAGQSARVDNCLFYNMGEQALEINSAASNSHVGTFINCTVSSVTNGVVNNRGTCTVANSIFSNCGGGGLIGNGSATYDYSNLFYNNAPSGTITATSGRVGGDPQFTSWNNFQLQSTSPARDTGITRTEVLDLDGLTRPANGAFDIGCHEYGATSGTTPRHVLQWSQVEPD